MSRREKEIRMMASNEELQNISNNAKKLNMQLAPYLRLVGQNPTIVQFDYSIIANHTKEMSEVRDTINRLIFTIEASNNYLPKEIETIVARMNGLFESENKLLQTLREQRIREYEKGRAALKQEMKKAQEADDQ